ncbi:tetratricopeptide repeat protein [Thermodesulfovibrionales bacterium]|nr:tetratricopeptide repeat protein [Thermodesulfovibrionales bacterium]
MSRELCETSKKRLFGLLFLSFACYLIVTGCSMPRIIIFDDPLTPEQRINLGVVYEREGKFNKAIKEYRMALKSIPIAYLYLGNVHKQMGKMYEAKRYYRKAINTGTDIADAYNNLAWLHYKGQENLEEAESLALRALEIDPSNKSYLNTLTRIKELRSKKGYTECKSYYPLLQKPGNGR